MMSAPQVVRKAPKSSEKATGTPRKRQMKNVTVIRRLGEMSTKGRNEVSSTIKYKAAATRITTVLRRRLRCDPS
ncbi:hypothetical protein CDEF62S_04606 [Castellaniella defragrans]